MSLTSFVQLPDVRTKLQPLRPKLPRKLDAPLKVAPRSKRYPLVGTAFDYLLRFDLQRRAPHAVSERWIAEYAPELIWREGDSISFGLDVLRDTDPALYLPPDEVAARARAVLNNAKQSVAEYVKLKTPSRAQCAEVAVHAISLAKLDSVYRAWRLDPRFEDVDSDDIYDLLDLLAIVPFHALLHDDLLWLNPNFRDASELVGGADADLIAGDMIVDVKTTIRGSILAGDLDQLLGYFLLARRQRFLVGSFPEINRLGLYFSRHGHLWSVDQSTWTTRPEFFELESWFFQRAEKQYALR